MADSPTNGELAIMIADMRREGREAHERMVVGLSEVKDRMDTANGRIGALEKWQYSILGGLTLGSIIAAPIVVEYLSRLLNR